MNTTDIWRSAAQLVKYYGHEAEVMTAQEAGRALDEGDRVGFGIWMHISNVVGELLRQKSTTDEPVN